MNLLKSPLREYYEIPPGFEFRGVTILHNSPMLMGFKPKKSKILLPFINPVSARSHRTGCR
ncbi:MAG: hypothetical protein LLF84_09290 [Methanoregulaceae archaeon]|nr:hypothetical protein [Methanoregulaceae archaeon]